MRGMERMEDEYWMTMESGSHFLAGKTFFRKKWHCDSPHKNDWLVKADPG